MNSSEALYPTLSQWQSIQGGEPMVISNRLKTLFQVVHVYDPEKGVDELTLDKNLPRYDNELRDKYSHYGCVIDTPSEQFIDSASHQEGLILKGNVNVVYPSILEIHKHGKPCASRSRAAGYEAGYRKIDNKKSWMEFLENKAGDGWIVWAIQRAMPVAKVVNRGSINIYL